MHVDRPWLERVDPSNVIPSGLFELDEVLFCGVGGFVRGGRYEVFGTKGAGKSSLIYRIIAGAQKKFPGEGCAIIDAEQSHDPSLIGAHARAQGADPEGVLVFGPENGSLDHSYRLIEDLGTPGRGKPKISCLFWDSYGATIPIPTDKARRKKFDAKEFGPSKVQMAENARINRIGIARARDVCYENNILLVVINQAITVWHPGGVTEIDSAGGHGFHHMFDARIRVARKQRIKEKGVVVGHEMFAVVKDSRIFPAGRETGPRGDCPHMAFYYDGRTVGRAENVFLKAVEAEVVQKAGAYYSWGGVRAQGREAFLSAIMDRIDELWAETSTRVLASYGDGGEEEEAEE